MTIFQGETGSVLVLILQLSGRGTMGISAIGFYESDVLHATKPSVWKHWKEHTELATTFGFINILTRDRQTIASSTPSDLTWEC